LKFNLKKLGVGAGVGLLDIGLEKIDESQGLSAPLNAQTIGRIGLFAIGLIGSAMGKYEEILETVYIAEEPLLIRSAAKLGGLITDYAEAPSREAIELRLRSAGQAAPPMRRAQFR
jgi:hypothetical protein